MLVEEISGASDYRRNDMFIIWFLSQNLYYKSMLTKSKITYIQFLHEKSGRRESRCFIVEWKKGIEEFLASDFEIVEWFFIENPLKEYEFPYEIITEKELGKITTLGNNNYGLIVVKMRTSHSDEGRISTEKNRETEQIPRPSEWQKSDKFTLILDGINDPGNLGTIIRIADWYGISHIVCSLDTVDCYNPKVIMATMGSLTRVSLFYTDLRGYLAWIDRKVYWAYLEGESIHTKKFTQCEWYLVIGSESHGISPHLEQYITDKITIPRLGLAESLNAGVATAIMLDRMTERYVR